MEAKNTCLQRNMGIELLRIVSMMAIMVLHVLGQGGILGNVIPGTAGYNTAWFLEILCYFGVTAYGIISGFVGIDGRYRFSNLIYLWLQVFFYMLIPTVCFAFLVPGSVGKTELLGLVFPVITEQYWYFSAYFGVFLLAPFVRFAFDKLERSHLRAILWIGIFITVIGPLISNVDVFGLRGGLSLGWILMAYFIGAYIKKFECFSAVKTPILIVVFVLSVFVTFGFKLVSVTITNPTISELLSEKLIAYNSITLLPASVAAFIIFSRIDIQGKMAKFVSLVAPLSFGVYLSNCQPLVWKYLMLNRFAVLSEIPFWGMAIRVILSALIIFFVGIAIDGVRKLLFDVLRVKQRLEVILKFGRID